MRLRPTPVFLVLGALYTFQYCYEGGKSYISPDGESYLAISRGESASSPFRYRLLKPRLAALISSVSGVSEAGAFRLLTPIELTAALGVVLALLRRAGSTAEWGLSVSLALGASLAVSFGHAPILVDPLLLLLTALMLLNLERGKLVPGLALACLAAITKEYGLLLGFAWSAYAFRSGRPRLAFVGAFIPAILFFVFIGTSPQSARSIDLVGFMRGSISYQLQLLKSEYAAKIVYFWSWAILWPLFLLTAISLAHKARTRVDARDLASAVMLLAVPMLMIGDWERSFLIVVPFLCLASAVHPLTCDSQFSRLLATGGLCTAVAKPLYTSLPMPRSLTLTLASLSLLTAVLIAAKILISLFPLGRRQGLEPELDKNR